MKVLLIEPSMNNIISFSIPSIESEDSGFYPPLGLMYLAAYLTQNSDHQVQIIDMPVEKMTYETLEKEIKERAPDVVGIHATTFTIVDALLVANTVKKVKPHIHVCLGGPHTTIYPEETIDRPEIDFLVLGEGEVIFTELINALENGGDLKKIKGIVFKRGGKIINNGLAEPISDLNKLPFPNRKLIPYQKYHSIIARHPVITTFLTSRGCPYHCTFCYQFMGRNYRYRSVANVMEEIEECLKLGIKEFFFFDETFTINRERALAICDEIINRKLDISWEIRARVNTVDREMLAKFKKAGCERIQFGVETSSPEILKIIKKGITITQVREAFKMAKDVGLTTFADFMIGLPTETREQALRTIEFSKELKPNYVQFGITTPLPATELYESGFEKGLYHEDYWRDFARNPSKEFIPKVWEEHLLREELLFLLNYAYRSFYMRPSYILKELFRIKSFDELKRKVKGGLKISRLKSKF